MADDEKGIKSAFELAMERLKHEAGDQPELSSEQKTSLSEIDRETKAKEAEQEILLKSRIEAAAATGDLEEVGKLREQLAAELRRIRERGEAKKEEVRKQDR
jgi:hypothetical protein